MSEKIGYTNEFANAWASEREFLEVIGLKIDAAILFGSAAYGCLRMINKNEEKRLFSNFPNATNIFDKLPDGTVASDVDLIVLSNNSLNVARKIRNAGIPPQRPRLYGLGNLKVYETGLPELGKLLNISVASPFSPRIPFSEVYVLDEYDYIKTLREIRDTCANPLNNDLESIVRLEAFVQAIKLGHLLEGTIPDEIKEEVDRTAEVMYKYRLNHPASV